jgi:hypothetical protein
LAAYTKEMDLRPILAAESAGTQPIRGVNS